MKDKEMSFSEMMCRLLNYENTYIQKEDEQRNSEPQEEKVLTLEQLHKYLLAYADEMYMNSPDDRELLIARMFSKIVGMCMRNDVEGILTVKDGTYLNVTAYRLQPIEGYHMGGIFGKVPSLRILEGDYYICFAGKVYNAHPGKGDEIEHESGAEWCIRWEAKEDHYKDEIAIKHFKEEGYL